MADLSIGGIIPPLVTPLSGSCTLDREALCRIIDHLVEGGVTGIFLLGSTGEWASLPAEARKEVVIQGIACTHGRLPVWVNISDNSLVEVQRKADEAALAGADGLVMAPPGYYSMTQDELRKFLDLAIEGIPLPVMLYNAPQYTRTVLAPETVRALSNHDNVLGIKDSSGDLDYLSSLIRTNPPKGFSILVGSETLLWESRQMGCKGGVCGGANLFPLLYSQFFQTMQGGDPDRITRYQLLIRRIQEEVYHNFTTTLSHVIGLKYLMELRGLCRSQMAAPVYQQLTPAQKRSMSKLLDEFIAMVF